MYQTCRWTRYGWAYLPGPGISMAMAVYPKAARVCRVPSFCHVSDEKAAPCSSMNDTAPATGDGGCAMAWCSFTPCRTTMSTVSRKRTHVILSIIQQPKQTQTQPALTYSQSDPKDSHCYNVGGVKCQLIILYQLMKHTHFDSLKRQELLDHWHISRVCQKQLDWWLFGYT